MRQRNKGGKGLLARWVLAIVWTVYGWRGYSVIGYGKND
jgi:hypothetical protein